MMSWVLSKCLVEDRVSGSRLTVRRTSGCKDQSMLACGHVAVGLRSCSTHGCSSGFLIWASRVCCTLSSSSLKEGNILRSRPGIADKGGCLGGRRREGRGAGRIRGPSTHDRPGDCAMPEWLLWSGQAADTH